jgi:hypothetical protein
LLDRLDVLSLEPGIQRSNATGNIEAHSTGRYDSASISVEGRHTSNRKTIAPVCIGHGIGSLYDTWESCHVRDLFINLVIHIPN